MGWLRKRFGEASTYAGLSVAATILAAMNPRYADLINAAAAALAGGAIVVPEKG